MSKQREALELALKALERGRPQIVGVLVQQDQDKASNPRSTGRTGTGAGNVAS